MKTISKDEAAYNFFVAFGRAHGAEVRVAGELLDQGLDADVTQQMQRDYPLDTGTPDSFPIKLTFPFRSAINPDAPELGTVSDTIQQIRPQLAALGYDADPNRFSGWNLARGVHAIQTTHGHMLKGSAIEVTIHEPTL